MPSRFTLLPTAFYQPYLTIHEAFHETFFVVRRQAFQFLLYTCQPLLVILHEIHEGSLVTLGFFQGGKPVLNFHKPGLNPGGILVIGP
jgi:hypothetical protein